MSKSQFDPLSSECSHSPAQSASHPWAAGGCSQPEVCGVPLPEMAMAPPRFSISSKQRPYREEEKRGFPPLPFQVGEQIMGVQDWDTDTHQDLQPYNSVPSAAAAGAFCAFLMLPPHHKSFCTRQRLPLPKQTKELWKGGWKGWKATPSTWSWENVLKDWFKTRAREQWSQVGSGGCPGQTPRGFGDFLCKVKIPISLRGGNKQTY